MEVGREAGQEPRPRRFQEVEASKVRFKELEQGESPPPAPPPGSSKGAQGAHGACPRGQGCPAVTVCPPTPLSQLFFLVHALFLVFSLFTPLPLSFSVPLLAHSHSPLQDPLGKLGPAAQGPRARAGHLAPRPGGRCLRKLGTNPGVRPALQPCPSHPLISSCHLPMLPLWKSH